MFRIAMVSDYFHPRLGGVENHILNLSKGLRSLGHVVVIITHANSEVSGIHFVEGFKTYYLDLPSIFGGAVFPTFLVTAAVLPQVFVRERIDIVHGHQCTTLALEGVFLAKVLGICTVFTNHSIVLPETIGGILTASAMQFSLLDADEILCVSRAARDNTAARLEVDAKTISVIPNAVTQDFTPNQEKKTHGETVIAVVSRLTYRKGTGLLAQVIPDLCKISGSIRIIVAGDGNKREVLEQVVERHQLQNRVQMLGPVPPSGVKEVLNRSDLFLNTSLTEAFCISILEAAACGLYVVSTDVDGVSEVLPRDMATLTDTTAKSLISGVKKGLEKAKTYDKKEAHRRVTEMYSWDRVSAETERAYRRSWKDPGPLSAARITRSVRAMLQDRKKRFSPVFLLILFLNYIFAVFSYALEWRCACRGHSPGPTGSS